MAPKEKGWEVVSEVAFVLPSLPPSVNAIYQIIFRQRRVQMKPEVLSWKTKAKEYIPPVTAHEETDFFRVDATFVYNFLYKNGKVKKFDTQNLMKVLIDAIAEKVGFNDSLVKFACYSSYHDEEEEKVYVTLQQVRVRNE